MGSCCSCCKKTKTKVKKYDKAPLSVSVKTEVHVGQTDATAANRQSQASGFQSNHQHYPTAPMPYNQPQDGGDKIKIGYEN